MAAGILVEQTADVQQEASQELRVASAWRLLPDTSMLMKDETGTSDEVVSLDLAGVEEMVLKPVPSSPNTGSPSTRLRAGFRLRSAALHYAQDDNRSRVTGF